MSSTARRFRFGDYELDTHAGELRKKGVRIRLQGQPIQVLAILLRNQGELVSREDLKKQLWQADTFVDFDHSLHNAIARVREALGDSVEKPQYIETLPKRGYRFIGRTQEIGSPQPELPVAPTSLPAKTSSRWIAYVSVIVILAASSLWIASDRGTAPAEIRSIAVLPLENLSGDTAQDYFADATTDELITNLAKVGSLRVTSRTTVSLYKHTTKTLPEIARELNVDGIVEGSIARSGQRVRVTAQLIRASSDQHLWAESYERNVGDALQLQSDLAQAIAEQVRVQLTPDLKAQFSVSRSVNPGAYDSYLRGRYYIYNVSFTDPKTLNLAKEAFEDAIRQDPSFSSAYSGLAQTYVCIATYTATVSPAEAFRLARQAVNKAIELDPKNGEAYDALGALKWHADFDWQAADQAFSKGVALSPSYSCAHEDRAVFLALMGRRTEALAEVEKSKQIDPGPISAGTELAVFIQLRDWARLLEASRQQLASNENDWLMHMNLGLGYEGTGRFPEAIAEYQRAIELSNGNDLNAVASLGHAYAVAGRLHDAKKILGDLEQKSREGKASTYLPATIYAGLDEKERALELIEKAYRDKSLDIGWILKADLRTDNLRSDPRFHDLLRRVGLPE